MSNERSMDDHSLPVWRGPGLEHVISTTNRLALHHRRECYMLHSTMIGKQTQERAKRKLHHRVSMHGGLNLV